MCACGREVRLGFACGCVLERVVCRVRFARVSCPWLRLCAETPPHGTHTGRAFVGRTGTSAEEANVWWRAVADAAIAVHGDSHGAAIE